MLGRIPAGGVPGEDECAKLLQRAQARLRRNERRRPLLLDARWFSVRSSYDFHATLEHVELFNHRRVPESIRNMPPR
jgi:hypothetical protein